MAATPTLFPFSSSSFPFPFFVLLSIISYLSSFTAIEETPFPPPVFDEACSSSGDVHFVHHQGQLARKSSLAARSARSGLFSGPFVPFHFKSGKLSGPCVPFHFKPGKLSNRIFFSQPEFPNFIFTPTRLFSLVPLRFYFGGGRTNLSEEVKFGFWFSKSAIWVLGRVLGFAGVSGVVFCLFFAFVWHYFNFCRLIRLGVGGDSLLTLCFNSFGPVNESIGCLPFTQNFLCLVFYGLNILGYERLIFRNELRSCSFASAIWSPVTVSSSLIDSQMEKQWVFAVHQLLLPFCFRFGRVVFDIVQTGCRWLLSCFVVGLVPTFHLHPIHPLVWCIYHLCWWCNLRSTDASLIGGLPALRLFCRFVDCLVFDSLINLCFFLDDRNVFWGSSSYRDVRALSYLALVLYFASLLYCFYFLVCSFFCNRLVSQPL